MKKTTFIALGGLLALATLQGSEPGAPFNPPSKVRLYDWSSQISGQNGPDCALHALHNAWTFARARKARTLPLLEDVLNFDQVGQWRDRAMAMRSSRENAPLCQNADQCGFSSDDLMEMAQDLGFKNFSCIFPFRNSNDTCELYLSMGVSSLARLGRVLREFHTHDYTSGPFVHAFDTTRMNEGEGGTSHATAWVCSVAHPGGSLDIDCIDSDYRLDTATKWEKNKKVIVNYITKCFTVPPGALTAESIEQPSFVPAIEQTPPLLPSKESWWSRILNRCRYILGLPVQYRQHCSQGNPQRIMRSLALTTSIIVGGALLLRSNRSSNNLKC